MGHAESHANAGGQLAVAFNARQDPDAWTEHTGPLDTDGSTQAVAYAVRTANTVANGHGISPELAHTLDLAHGQAVCVTGDVTHTLRAEGFDASEDGTGRGQPIVAAYGFQPRIARNGRGDMGDLEIGRAHV